MALIKCPEYGREVSDIAELCPNIIKIVLCAFRWTEKTCRQ